ncbi:MAG: diguanylate cyclase [Sideroxydans sp.]|nr:diguanylate cyclase [Sideroxydans sp.]
MKKKKDALKVLVVDDSKVVTKVLTNYLASMGITHPLLASTGKQAIELFKSERPDIVLLDVQLPDIDGFDVSKAIRKLEGKGEWSAIIFLTSMANDADLARGIEAGGDDYLTKPIAQVVLHAKIRAMQRLVEMQRQLVSAKHKLDLANTKLKRISTTDALTGIANRRAFDEFSELEWRRCMRKEKPMALVMLDIDYFKLFNDKYGHQAGDDCLKLVAGKIAKATPRAADLCVRFGGEEFMVVLSETDLEGAQCMAERVRQMVADLKIPHYATASKHVAVSCGVVSVIPNEKMSLEAMVKSVDVALYMAKRGGRDRVVAGEYSQA